MGFSFWVTTRSPLSVEALGNALAEVAPEVVVLPRPDGTAPVGSDIASLGAFRFAFAVEDGAVEMFAAFSASVDDGGAGTCLSFSPSSEPGSMAICLGIAAAALRAAGGTYGDDADDEWSPKKVAAEYVRARRDFVQEWARLDGDERTARLEASRAAALHAQIAAACMPGKEAELAAMVRASTAAPELIEAILERAWRAESPSAVRIALSEGAASAARDGLLLAFGAVGGAAERHASFLVEQAGALALLDADGRAAVAARLRTLPDPDVRRVVEQGLKTVSA